MDQLYDGSNDLPNSAIEEAIAISKRRAERIGSMKEALLKGDFDKVIRIAEVLCGLSDEHE
jgi:hypothetical protein